MFLNISIISDIVFAPTESHRNNSVGAWCSSTDRAQFRVRNLCS